MYGIARLTSSRVITTSEHISKMKKILLIILCLISLTPLQAQQDNDSGTKPRFSIGLSFGLGGTSPLPLPQSIRKICSYQPLYTGGVEGRVEWKFKNSRWGIATAERWERKGMHTEADVKAYHVEMTADDGGYMEGDWTGKVKTRVCNICLTFPLLATYQVSRTLSFEAGPYVSYLISPSFSGEVYDGYIRHHDPTGDKAYVSHAVYNFSNDLVKWNVGVEAGVRYAIAEHYALSARLDWGITNIFPANYKSVRFALYPIYGFMGIHYCF